MGKPQGKLSPLSKRISLARPVLNLPSHVQARFLAQRPNREETAALIPTLIPEVLEMSFEEFGPGSPGEGVAR